MEIQRWSGGQNRWWFSLYHPVVVLAVPSLPVNQGNTILWTCFSHSFPSHLSIYVLHLLELGATCKLSFPGLWNFTVLLKSWWATFNWYQSTVAPFPNCQVCPGWSQPGAQEHNSIFTVRSSGDTKLVLWLSSKETTAKVQPKLPIIMHTEFELPCHINLICFGYN